MTDKEFFMTKEKHQELAEELDVLTNTRRQEIAQKLEYAKSLGDLSENAEYHDARQEQAETEARIREIDNLLSHAKIVSHKKSDTVEIGSTVKVRKGQSRTDQEFVVVGSEEANMLEGKISYTSPLGSALMGKKKGETCTLETPAGEVKYKITGVK